MQENQNQQESNKQPDDDGKDTVDKVKSYARYSGMAFQMGIIILIGTLIGRKIDAYFELETPWGTVVFALLSIFAALYITLKDLK